ncbi:phosphodiesterase [Treponema sp.]|uniref:phosphodiesterase n=1 Tax=Treponema sp. TaxID=166 RepID=UPI00298E66EE|nr:phosphodiesterase [Treponema sp.]MCQ2241638.1 phosphodiesterase [Treponema sp.]
MKYLICSDIHGSESACKKIVEQFHRLNCDKILLLGDVLYHGPRNPLPEGHNPKGVIELLNPLADKIIACRGNCDAEVDQMVLKFSVLADYNQIYDDGVQIFCTHGHVYAPVRGDGNIPAGCETAGKRPIMNNPGIVFYGHTHVSVLEKNQDGIVVCNPGSISLPKGGTSAGFALYEKGKLALMDMDGNEIKSINV